MSKEVISATSLPSAIYVWLVPSEEVLEQPGSWRIRKWDTEPFPEANFALSAAAPVATLRHTAGDIGDGFDLTADQILMIYAEMKKAESNLSAEGLKPCGCTLDKDGRQVDECGFHLGRKLAAAERFALSAELETNLLRAHVLGPRTLNAAPHGALADENPNTSSEHARERLDAPAVAAPSETPMADALWDSDDCHDLGKWFKLVCQLERDLSAARLGEALHENAANQLAQMAVNAISEGVAPSETPLTVPELIDGDGNDLYPPRICNWITNAAKRIDQLERDLAVAEACAHVGTAPCGHSDQYCYSEDGGAHIVCLLCERKSNLSAMQPVFPLALVEWLQRWWKRDAAWRNEQRSQIGFDVAQLMRGVADMIEAPCEPAPIDRSSTGGHKP